MQGLFVATPIEWTHYSRPCGAHTAVYFPTSDLYLDRPQRQSARPNSQTGKRDVDPQLSNNDITPVSSPSQQLGTTS